MELIFLGHASWLLQMGELRIVFDPLLAGPHHGGVFEVFPPRRIHEAELRADFVVVSHRHPDHFDVQSLRRLAALDPDTVLLTSDELVEETALALGFRSVRRLGAFDRVALDAGELLTTPSYGTEVEWGVIAVHERASVWNQIDSVVGGPARVRETLEHAARAFGRSEPRLPIDLGIVRWQPLLEIEAQIGGPTGFPLRAYAELLDELAALQAAAIVPGSAGSRHAAPHAHMNRIVYPLSEARFVRDAVLRAPATVALAPRVGGRYRVWPGGAEDSGDASELVELLPAHDDRLFRPFELPPIVDPARDVGREPEIMGSIEGWVKTALAPALGRAFGAMHSDRALVFALEVIGSSETRAFSLTVDGAGTELRSGLDRDYDALCAIAASELAAVIAGEKSWGEPLLAGLLRATTRAYRVDAQGVAAANVGVPFLYYALSYEESVRRAVAFQLSASFPDRAAPRS